jgi:hypothetical protein
MAILDPNRPEPSNKGPLVDSKGVPLTVNTDQADKDIKSFKDRISKLTANITVNTNDLKLADDLLGGIADKLKEAATELGPQLKNITGKFNEKLTISLDRIEDVVDLMESGADSLKLQRSIQADIADLEKEIAESKAKDNTEYAKILDTQKSVLSNLKEQLQEYEKIKEVRDQISPITEGFSDISKNVISEFEKIPGGKLVSKIFKFDKIADNLTKTLGNKLTRGVMSGKLGKLFGGGSTAAAGGAAAGGTATGGAAAAAGGEAATAAAGTAARGALAVVGGIGAAVGGLVLAIGLLLKKMNDLRDDSIDLARSQSLTTDEAGKQLNYYKNIARQSKLGAGGISDMGEEITKTGISLQNLLGTNKLVKTDVIDAAVSLQKYMKLTEEESIGFVESMSFLDEPFKDSELTLQAMTDEINNFTNMGLKASDVAKELAKTSKSILINYKGQNAALVKAIGTAKQYGMTLEEANKFTSSLLDLESSIQSEMEARVITGKDINFAQARYLQLQGKTDEALASVMDQLGGIEEIESMLPMQREALAKSFGMNADEMLKAMSHAKTFRNLTGDQMKKINEMSVADIERSKTLNESQKESIIKDRQAAKMSEMGASAMAKLAAFIDILISGDFDFFWDTGESNQAAMNKRMGITEESKARAERIANEKKAEAAAEADKAPPPPGRTQAQPVPQSTSATNYTAMAREDESKSAEKIAMAVQKSLDAIAAKNNSTPIQVKVMMDGDVIASKVSARSRLDNTYTQGVGNNYGQRS